MPKEITDKLLWLFLLLPGLVSVFLIGLIVDFGQLTEFQITFYSAALTLINVALAMPVFWTFRGIARRTRLGPAADKSQTVLFCTIVVMVSIVTGIALGIAAERDTFFVTLRSMSMTAALNKRSSNRPVVFLLSQNTKGRLNKDGDGRRNKQSEAWALVHMKGGRQFEGWPEFYELGSKPSEIYLSPACEVTGRSRDTSPIRPLDGPGVILYEAEIQSIELIDRSASKCFAHWIPPESTSSAGAKE